MPAKKTKIKIVEGSCNTCKYRVSVPKDSNSRDLDAVHKPSCCFHRQLDFKTNKPQSDCTFYSYSDFYIKHQEELEHEE